MNRRWLAYFGIALLAWCVAGTPQPTTAGELDWRLVPEGWRWILHLDVDRLRESPAAGQILAKFWERFPERNEIQAMASLAEADIENGLRAVAFLGRSFDAKKGLILVQLRVNQARLVDFVATNPQYGKETVDGIVIHRWYDAGEKTFLSGAFLPGDWIVVGRDSETVRALVEHFPKQPQSARSDPFYAVREGTYLQIHANTMDELSIPFVSPLLRRSRRLTAAVGEHRGQAFIQATFEVEGAETALNVRDAITGLIAIGKLHYADEPRYVALLDHAKVFASENKTTFIWSAPGEDILTVAEKVLPWLRKR